MKSDAMPVPGQHPVSDKKQPLNPWLLVFITVGMFLTLVIIGLPLLALLAPKQTLRANEVQMPDGKVLRIEAVTWGKVDRDTYEQTTESMQADYSMIMPFLVKALLDNRARYARWADRMGEEDLFAKHPQARGYLRPRDGYRLFSRRDELRERLVEQVRQNRDWLLGSLHYPGFPAGGA